MNGVYIVSTNEYAGKSTIAMSLAIELKKKKKKVAYMKPIGTLPKKVDGQDSCEDVDYIWNALDKPGELKHVCPIVLLSRFAEKAFGEEKVDYKKIIKDSAKRLSKKHDYVVLEGAGNVNQGGFIGLSAGDVADLLDIPTIIIAKYKDMLTIDDILQAANMLKSNLLGVIVNMVPVSAEHVVKDILKPFMEKHNVKYLGLIERDKKLGSVSVGKIAQHLNGKVLAAKDNLDKMVETFMVGAMSQEQAISFFRKKANKAVVTGGDRSDVQLAALETDTNALILTGNLMPRPIVVSKADELGVPVILVKEDTLTTVEKAEHLYSHVRVHENQKVEHMRELLEQNIDLDYIYKSLGV